MQNAVAKTSRVQNRLQMIWISIEARATLQWISIWCPMFQLVEHSSIEQTWSLGIVKLAPLVLVKELAYVYPFIAIAQHVLLQLIRLSIISAL